ncbi:MerC domain-containing protein [Granulicella cerasi]|uniref:MerC domain-containing protein n=1 Tax=Granulicella cerasi TaxID=741063 RepID=A0ABW1Z729_9BACT|nr:MerC domain-containing protein [Granulicella cerasi]
MTSSRTDITTWADRLGIATSALCVVHCLCVPVLISFSAVAAHFMPSEERSHRTLAVVVSLLGTIALVRGFRTHGRRRVLGLMAAGLAFIATGAFAGDRLSAHWQEVAITFCGSLLMIAAHRINHTFCRDCVCADHCCDPE